MAEGLAVSPARTRLTLDMSERLNTAIEAYAAAHGLTKADVLRNAVEFLLKAERATSEGMTVGAWKDDQKMNRRIEREFVVPGLT